MRKSNYDKKPATKVAGNIWIGKDEIIARLTEEAKKVKGIWAIECYQGVRHDELIRLFKSIGCDNFIDTADLMRSPEEIDKMTHVYLTDDRLFGRRNTLSYSDFFDPEKLNNLKLDADGLTIIYGHGASLVAPEASVLIYADMPRWEIQMRSRRHEVTGIGVDNASDAPSIHYKRGYFLDWVICDALKRRIMDKVNFWIDSVEAEMPKMIDAETFAKGLDATVARPFRVVPFFDPAPWGGQWMKEVCGLDPNQANYGWCFDCVPEENSLYLNVNGTLFEMPSNNLVFGRTRRLLGAPVEARFGQDFPIRFDFLDTIGGGNLSLQVHPTTQYIRETFGIPYTQDESYYLLDAEEGATVYLGLKTGVNPDEMIAALNFSQETGKPFDAEKFVNKWPAKKHDHYLIPAGTIHCSGAGAMVLEISATPSIFTFKLYDWGRLGLDGLPRPINIGHGSHVIQWERQTDLIASRFINRVEFIAEGEGWIEERTGLHENEFIETRRHWFTSPVTHHTGGGVNVLNVIEGDELIVESPTGAFEPFVVHYAETFIVPAAVVTYTIRPYGASKGKKCGTIKAYVRFRE